MLGLPLSYMFEVADSSAAVSFYMSIHSALMSRMQRL
jgi:hypothetical protein